ncbi:hypothetical protein [Pseudomonas syringae]|uniref:hypothetical protein n=1 Tax=Pseudomonas syringae TaxID=317 RepID=UPI0011AFBB27|nr:hypothetical protein [Pseudomonas syringae]
MDPSQKLTYEQNYLYQLGCLTFVESKHVGTGAEKNSNQPMLNWAADAIDQHQLAIVLNSHNFPYGYYHWAWLTPQVISSVVGSSTYLLHKSEINEGDYLFIMACGVEPGGFRLLLKDMLARLSLGGVCIHWFGRKGRANRIVRFDPHLNKISYLHAGNFDFPS